MAISISNSTVLFDRDGLLFSGGMPGAVLLLGAEEREVTWAATSGGVPQVRSRLTPLGAAQESVFSWTFLDGFRLDWHVMRPDLSHGALVMTFDDMHTGPWLAAAPIFAQQAARVTFFVGWADRLNPQQIEDLKALRQRGHAMACHGLRHEKAVDFVAANGMEEYLAKEIKPANAALAGMGFTPSAFAYPSSQNNPVTDAALLQYFRHLRTGGIAVTPGLALKDVDAVFVPASRIAETGCLVGAGIDYLGTGGKTRPVEQVLEALDRARERGEIIVLYAHNISATGPGHHITPDALSRVLAHAKAIGLPAVTYDDLP